MTDTIEPMGARIDQQQLAQQLVNAARADGVELVGPSGLLTGLTKTVLETALEAEMTEHLGYEAHDAAGRDGGNSRNGTRRKTVLTEIGPVEIEVPSDRDASFEPVIVRRSTMSELSVNGSTLRPRRLFRVRPCPPHPLHRLDAVPTRSRFRRPGSKVTRRRGHGCGAVEADEVTTLRAIGDHLKRRGRAPSSVHVAPAGWRRRIHAVSSLSRGAGWATRVSAGEDDT
jgi:hypothetical protein